MRMERLLAGVVEAPTPPAAGDGQSAVEMAGIVPARVSVNGDDRRPDPDRAEHSPPQTTASYP